jgi:general secretion pathway protein I
MKNKFANNVIHKMQSIVGFTLMEVLVALVILAISFASIFMAISMNARNFIYLKDKTAAGWVGLDVMARLQLGFLTLSSIQNESANSEYFFDKKWYWRVKTLPSEDINLLRIEVEVMPAENARRIFHLTGYLSNDK